MTINQFQSKTLTNKELINIISENSKYHKYQIEDILHALAVAVSYSLREGYDVKIRGLGTFTPKPPRRITNYSPYSGKHMDKMTKSSCKFKPDTLILNLLNLSEGEFKKFTESKGEDDES